MNPDKDMKESSISKISEPNRKFFHGTFVVALRDFPLIRIKKYDTVQITDYEEGRKCPYRISNGADWEWCKENEIGTVEEANKLMIESETKVNLYIRDLSGTGKLRKCVGKSVDFVGNINISSIEISGNNVYVDVKQAIGIKIAKSKQFTNVFSD